MSISSLVVHAHPDSVEAVQKRLVAFEGVEIHAVSNDGKMVVTVDVPDERKAADTLLEMQKQDGILSASLIYNHFENTTEPSPVKEEQVR